MRHTTALIALVLAACAAAPRATSTPLRAFYVPMTAPACVEDEGELGASIAALRFEDGEGDPVLTPPQSVLVRATHDCSVATRERLLRLSTSEALAEGCVPNGAAEACAFVRSCWALGGPADRTCDASDQAHVSELFGMLDDGPHVPGLFEHDPAGRHDAPTVYVVTGTFFYGQGHLVQRIEGVWRVVVSALVWQA